jgi:transposase-like protein
MGMEAIKNQAKSQKGQGVPNWTEDQAREYFEQRRWPNGPGCVHCGSVNVYRLQGKSTRPGLLECRDCRKQFTVTVGTVMEDSHLPLSTWAKAFHLLVSSKKGFSALQLQRNLGLGSYRTAWFLAHRIREAMRCEPLAGKLCGQVQADETYVGGKPRKFDGKKHKSGRGTPKTPVVALVETGGKAVSHVMESTNSEALKAVIHKSVDKDADLVTDEFRAYGPAAMQLHSHRRVNHTAGEYVGKDGITTNTAESFFALMKRGHYGVYHSMSKKHLHRYCNEFDFRWNGRGLTDSVRRDAAVEGAEGKRLMYKSPMDAKDN